MTALLDFFAKAGGGGMQHRGHPVLPRDNLTSYAAWDGSIPLCSPLPLPAGGSFCVSVLARKTLRVGRRVSRSCCSWLAAVSRRSLAVCWRVSSRVRWSACALRMRASTARSLGRRRVRTNLRGGRGGRTPSDTPDTLAHVVSAAWLCCLLVSCV